MKYPLEKKITVGTFTEIHVTGSSACQADPATRSTDTQL